jgi:hypothetical protein
MSTDLISMREIPIGDLLDGRLRSHGIRGGVDEHGVVWLCDDAGGFVEAYPSTSGMCEAFMFRGLGGIYIMLAVELEFAAFFLPLDEVFHESEAAALDGESEVRKEEIFRRIFLRYGSQSERSTTTQLGGLGVAEAALDTEKPTKRVPVVLCVIKGGKA